MILSQNDNGMALIIKEEVGVWMAQSKSISTFNWEAVARLEAKLEAFWQEDRETFSVLDG